MTTIGEETVEQKITSATDAIDAAIRHFAALEQSYRSPSGEKALRMSKQNRQGLAARYAQWQRDLESLKKIVDTAEQSN